MSLSKVLVVTSTASAGPSTAPLPFGMAAYSRPIVAAVWNLRRKFAAWKDNLYLLLKPMKSMGKLAVQPGVSAGRDRGFSVESGRNALVGPQNLWFGDGKAANLRENTGSSRHRTWQGPQALWQ
jgi:hypothetical protein